MNIPFLVYFDYMSNEKAGLWVLKLSIGLESCSDESLLV